MSEPSNKVCVIVDAFSSGAFLAKAFKQRGYDCVHLLSSSNLGPFFSAKNIDRTDYLELLDHERDQGSVMQRLRELAPKHIIPGADTGVELATSLAVQFELATANRRASIATLFDKFEVIGALGRAGLHVASQVKARSFETLREFAHTQGWPIILKPLHSSGTQDVYRCDSEDDLRGAFSATLGKLNAHGRHNTEVLAQTLLEGTEYSVNTMSSHGAHRVTDICQYTKIFANGRHFIYRSIDALPWSGDVQRRLAAYAMQVLTALKIDFGPGHLEIIDTPRGPALVELGARLAGAGYPEVARSSMGQWLPDLVAEAYNSVPAAPAMAPGYDQQASASAVTLINPWGAGHWAPGALQRLQSLGSFQLMRYFAAPDEPLAQTIDFDSCPGVVILSSKSESALELDKAQVVQWEAEGRLFLPGRDE
jgi:biotin carboxylase